MDLGLVGKRALVGGGSKGLGLAAALALAREGCLVAIVSRSKENLEHAKAQFPDPSSVLTIAADLSTREGIDCISASIREWGNPDILVNNTGGPPAGRFFELSEEQWARAHESLLLYVKRMCDLFVPHMREQKWGRIITIASYTAREPVDNLTLSNVYRAGILAYAKTLARELAPYGITVNTVLPGAYLTERYQALLQHRAKTTGRAIDDVQREVLAQLPQGRFQQPEELGAVVAFLASVKASAITGAAIPVEGGLLRGIW